MGGGYISSVQAIASRDGQHILTAAGCSIRIYSTATAALVAELSGHTGDITALVLHPHSAKKVFSASKDGTVRLWDITEGGLLKTFAVNSPIISLAVPAVGLQAFVAATHASGDKHGRVLRLNTATGRVEEGAFKTSIARPLSVSPGGAYVATYDKHSLHIWATRHADCKPLTLHHTKAFTCVAFDAGEERVAAGDVSGRISIWNAYPAAVAASLSANPAAEQGRAGGGAAAAPAQQQQLQQKQQGGKGLARETLHWHSGPVRALAFSPEGAYLLSGGDEAVLVIWRLDNGARTYLPRLQGGLTGITPAPADPATYVLTQADNTIRLVNVATMRVLCSVHGLRPRVEGTRATVATLVPGSGQLALAGPGSVVQLFDTLCDRHVDRVQVGHRNVASLAGTDPLALPDAPPVTSHVAHIAFSGDGAVMATVDVHPSAGVSGPAGASLKFWDRRASGAAAGGAPAYALNSHISQPHRGPVTGLAYHPSQHMAATTSADGSLRIWAHSPARRRAAEGKGQPPAPVAAATWRCLSSSGYQGRLMTAVAFSGDGSLVAAAVPGSITLWDPAQNALVAVLANPGPAKLGAMSSVQFVPGTPFLAGTCVEDAPALVVWNLLTASVWWSAAAAVSCLAVDPAHGAFAVAFPPEPRRRVPAQSSSTPIAQPNGSVSEQHGTAPDLAALPAPNGIGAAAAEDDGGMSPTRVNGKAANGVLPNGGLLSSPESGWESPMVIQEAGASAPDDSRPDGQVAEAGPGSLGDSLQLASGTFWYGADAVAAASKAGMSAAGEVIGGGGGTVMLFEAGSPTPKHAWMLPRSGVAALMFAGQGTPLAESAADRCPPGSSPLLMLTDDRHFTILPAAGAPAKEETAAAAGRSAEPVPALVGYEAAFGPLRAAEAAAPEARTEQQQRIPKAEREEAVPRLAEIWDAPSHALPPPHILAEMSLEAMLAGLAH